jgi:preprotein translocase subunit YajC
MQHGAHSSGDTMLLLAIFVVFIVMFIGGFFLIWRPLRSENPPPMEPEDDTETP